VWGIGDLIFICFLFFTPRRTLFTRGTIIDLHHCLCFDVSSSLEDAAFRYNSELDVSFSLLIADNYIFFCIFCRFMQDRNELFWFHSRLNFSFHTIYRKNLLEKTRLISYGSFHELFFSWLNSTRSHFRNKRRNVEVCEFSTCFFF